MKNNETFNIFFAVTDHEIFSLQMHIFKDNFFLDGFKAIGGGVFFGSFHMFLDRYSAF